jgi:hypothetical protein
VTAAGPVSGEKDGVPQAEGLEPALGTTEGGEMLERDPCDGTCGHVGARYRTPANLFARSSRGQNLAPPVGVRRE